MGRDDAALQTLEVLVDYYHHDPDPTIAAAATGARIDRWLATRRVLRRSRWLSSAVREPILGLSGLIFRTRRRRHRELEYTQARDGPRHILVGRSLVALGRVVQIGAVIAASIVGRRSYDAGNFTSIKVVLAIGLLACGQVVVLLGKRLQGRFSPQMVRYTRPILPSTIFALALTLAVAWVSPFLERAGTTYVTALPIETYRWFLDRGLPTWAGIIAMVPLAPIEIFFILYIFTSVVLKPLGHLLGQHNALVEALEESFGSAWIE
jgi:hypothetical protein